MHIVSNIKLGNASLFNLLGFNRPQTRKGLPAEHKTKLRHGNVYDVLKTLRYENTFFLFTDISSTVFST